MTNPFADHPLLGDPIWCILCTATFFLLFFVFFNLLNPNVGNRV